MSIVVNVMGVMDGVILAAHDGIDVPVHGIVDIGCPHGGSKDHAQMGQVVAGNKGQEVHIRTGLQNTVERVKGHRRPGRQCFGLVVIVVLQVNMFVQKLVRVKGAVHPVDANFDAEKVEGHCGNVVLPSTNFLNRVVNLCVTRFDQVFVQDGQHGVKGHGCLGQLYLSLDGLPAGSRSSLGLKDLFGLGVDVAKVMENSAC